METEQMFAALSEEYLKDTWRTYPVRATDLGIHDFDGELGHFHQDAISARVERLWGWQQRLRGKICGEELDAEGLCDLELLRSSIASELFDLQELRVYENNPVLYPQMVLDGVFLLLVREFAPLGERADRILARLEQVPRFLSEARQNLRDPSKVHVEVAIDVTTGGIRFIEEAIPPLAEKIESLGHKLHFAHEKASRAFKNYLTFLKEKALPGAREDFAVGREAFLFKLRHEHMLSYSLEEIFDSAEAGLIETRTRLRKLAQAIDPNKTWRQILVEMRRERPSWERLYRFCADEVSRARQFVVDTSLVTIPKDEELRLMETPTFLRSMMPYGGYNTPPVFQRKPIGLFYVTPVDASLTSNEKKLGGLDKYAIENLVVHETYPGHHLQFVHANRVVSKLRKQSMSSLFSEGWALYCEELMQERGYYRDRRSNLFQLFRSFWCTIRALVDIKMHTQGETVEHMTQMLLSETGLDESDAYTEVRRYALSPTEPLSYFWGKKEILNIREQHRYQTRTFNLRRFHDTLLSFGIIPPRLVGDLLRERGEMS